MLAGSTKSGKQVRITVKWDGAPAIFAGTNPENKKFFVGTKGVFAKCKVCLFAEYLCGNPLEMVKFF